MDRVDNPEPLSSWLESLSQCTDSEGIEVAYSKKAKERVDTLADAYRAGDVAGMRAAKLELQASRPFCSLDPFRGSYEFHMCWMALFLAQHRTDEFDFDSCYELCELVAESVEERRKRREAVGGVVAKESYLRMFLIAVEADAKWKGPGVLEHRHHSPEALVEAFLKLLKLVRPYMAQDADVELLTQGAAVAVLLTARRFACYAKTQIETAALELLGLDQSPPHTDNHWHWRLQAGDAYITRKLDPKRLVQLHRELLRTAPQGYEYSLDQYTAAVAKEIVWLRRSLSLSLVQA